MIFGLTYWQLVAAVLLVALSISGVVVVYGFRLFRKASIALEDMGHQLQNARECLAAANADLLKAKNLAKAHMDSNGLFEKQAQDAWENYRNAGIMAGNAQAMLFGELEKAVRALNQFREEKGKPPVKIDASLQNLVSEFKGMHVHD